MGKRIAATNTEGQGLQLLRQLQSSTAPVHAVVLGGSDTGKSSLCEYLARQLRQSGNTAVIDGDPGQGSFGPPATIGLHEYAAASGFLALQFIGAVTPAGHLLQMLTGMRKLLDQAQHFQHVLVDSSGYINGQVAREFNIHLLDMLRPTHIIGLQTGKELEPVLRVFDTLADTTVVRLKVERRDMQRRNPQQRRQQRRQQFQDYFHNANFRSLRLDRLNMHGFIPNLIQPEAVANRLIALTDSNRDVICLGIVVQCRIQQQSLRCLLPSGSSLSKVVHLQWSDTRIDPAELGIDVNAPKAI